MKPINIRGVNNPSIHKCFLEIFMGRKLGMEFFWEGGLIFGPGNFLVLLEALRFFVF